MQDNTQTQLDNYLYDLLSDPIKLKAHLRKVSGPALRELVEPEFSKIWTLLQLIEPFGTSNNQSSISFDYRLGNTIYQVLNSDGIYIFEELSDDN
jgi:hypothetical protein